MIRLLAILACLVGSACASTRARRAAQDGPISLGHTVAQVCAGVPPAMSASGYRLEETYALPDGGCVAIGTQGISLIGWGHALRVEVHPDPGGAHVHLTARRNIAINVSEPVASSKREVIAQLRCQLGDRCPTS